MIDYFRGIDDRRALDVRILIFIRVHDPKTTFVEHLTFANLDQWSHGPRGALLARVNTNISLRVDFLDGVVA